MIYMGLICLSLHKIYIVGAVLMSSLYIMF